MKFNTIKKIVEFTVVLLLLIGIFWIVFGSVLYAKNKDISDASEYNAFRAGFILSIAFGCFLLLWSVLGLVAACKKNNCLLGLYNVGIFFILLISIAILVISIIFAVVVPSYKDDTTCTQKQLLKDLKNLNQEGAKVLCQTPCQCQFEGSTLDAVNQAIINFNPKQGAYRVQDCDAYDQKKNYKDYKALTGLLRSMEETFDCSGVCSKNNYYVFSNVNNGVPDKDCKVEVLDYIGNNNIKLLVASSILTFALFMSLMFACCLCCMKRKGGVNYYERNGVGYNGGKQ